MISVLQGGSLRWERKAEEMQWGGVLNPGQHEPEPPRLHVAAEAHPYGCYRVVQEPAKME